MSEVPCGATCAVTFPDVVPVSLVLGVVLLLTMISAAEEDHTYHRAIEKHGEFYRIFYRSSDPIIRQIQLNDQLYKVQLLANILGIYSSLCVFPINNIRILLPNWE